MKIFKRILGLLLFLAGVVALFVSNYIKEQVAEGKLKIENAQGKLDEGHGILSLSPFTRSVGQEVTSSAQSKINAGQAEIDYYENMAKSLQIAGIVLIILGPCVFFIPFKKFK